LPTISSSLRPAFLLLVLCLLGVATTGTLGVAADAGKSASSSSDRGEQHAARAAEEREKRRRAADERATGEAKAERARSRSAYRGLGRAAALATAKRHHGKVVDAPVADPLPLRPGERLDKVLSAHTARIDLGEGKHGLASSTLPLRIGGKPFSLALERRGGDLAPENAVTDVRIGGRADEGVTLESGVRFAPAGATESAADVVADKAFFANALSAPDVDYLVEPMPAGVQALFVLRSSESPQAPALDFELPAGARLRPDGEGGAEVVRGDDVLTKIEPPSAWDADDVDVPARYVVQGDRLATRVEHAQGDVRYPILVDPVVKDSFDCVSGYCNGGSFPGWVPKPDTSHIGAGSWGYGLLTWYPANSYNSVAGWRDWRFYAVRQSHVYRWNSRQDHKAARSHLTEGISPREGAWEGEWHTSDAGPWNSPPNVVYGNVSGRWVTHCAAVGCSADAGTTGNFAQHGIWVETGSSSVQATTQVSAATVYQWDRNNPWVERVSDTIPAGWVTNANFQINVRGRDDGLGVARVGLGGDNFHIDRTKACANYPNDTAGNRQHQCNASEPETFNVDTAGFREGVNTVTAFADDVILRPRGHTSYSFRIDRQGPALGLSGALWDKRGKTVTGSAPITVNATDGTGGSDLTSRSGVKRAQLWVDGRFVQPEPGVQQLERSEASCDNCTLNGSLGFDAADYEDGVHTIRIRAWDYAGNETAEEFQVVTETRTPTVVATAHTTRPSTWIDAAVPSVSLRAEDFGGGVFSLGLEEPDGWKTTPATYGCDDTVNGRCAARREPSVPYNQSTAPLTEGVNSVSGRARDPWDNANPAAAARTGRGLRLEFWTTNIATQYERNASRVDHYWGTQPPHPEVGGDFSAKFSGKVIPRYSETYTFFGLADDKVKLTVNGQVLFDDPTWDNVEESGQIALQAGQAYDIVLETQDTGGNAEAHLSWSSPSQPREIVPPDRLLPPTAGLAGEFFDNKDLTGASYRRSASIPAGDWGTAAPDPRIGADTWSARFLGQVTPRYTDTYTFFTRADDGTRLWVDGKPLVDNWATSNAVVERSGQVTLEAGKAYDLRLEYFDDTGNASVHLDWQSPQQARQVVPIDRLAAPTGRTASWPVKVDKTPPDVSISGPLPEIEGEYVEGPTPLDFAATDGATTSPRSQRSGVKRWEIDPGNGQPVVAGAERSTVTDSQPWNDSATVAPSHSAYRDGRNDVAIAAMDQVHPEANHRGLSRRIPVWMDKTPPTLALAGSLADHAGTSIWDGSYDLTARANDGSHDDPRSGVRQVEVFLGKENADGTVSQETSVHRSLPRPGASANLLPNSSFERMPGQQGVPGIWAWNSSFSRVTADAAVHHGNHAGRLTATQPNAALIISDSARMSATPGEKVTFSGYVRAGTAGRRTHVAPRWFDASGQMIGEPDSQYVPAPTQRKRVSSTWTVPANTASMGWKVALKDHAVGETLDFDSLQVERGSTATEYAPRVTLNLFSNTSFEKAPGTDGTPNLGRFAATYDRVQDAGAVEHGSWAIRLRPNAANDAQLINDADKAPVTPGEKLNFSAFLRASATGSTAWVHARFFDAGGAFLGQHGTPARAVGTTRGKYAASWTVPDNVAQIGWAITFSGHNGTTTTPTTLDIDAVQVERGVDDSEYRPLTTANLFSNTSFERPSGQDGAPALHPYAPGGTWSRVQDSASIHHGRWAARLSASTALDHQLINDGEQVPVRWGERITFSGYGRSSAAQGQWTVSPRWRNDAGQFLGQHDTGWRPMTTSRQRFTGSVVVPVGATRVGWVVTMGGHAPGQTLDVDGIQAERADTASRYRPAKSADHHHTTSGWTFTPAHHEPGRYRVRVRATDHLGQSTDSSFVAVVDSPPELEVEGGLRSSPLATGRGLKATATDTYSGIREIEVFAKRVPATQLTPDGVSPSNSGEPRLHRSPCPSTADCKSAGGWTTSYELPSDFESGRYQFTVRATDNGGVRSRDQWVAEVVQVRSVANHKLGLEQWFALDDTDAGGGSTAYVNGDTGNAVWHQTPIVNPGRGLSTVVNLTYNSHARGGVLGADVTRLPVIGLNPEEDGAAGTEQLHGLAYNQAGAGFSIAVGGPTRVNEPLGGALQAGIVERAQPAPNAPWPGATPQIQLLDAASVAPGDAAQTRVSLTDADGTQHTFTRNPGDTAWAAPPGVDMRLEYVGDRVEDPIADPFDVLTVADLQDDEAWELLRPDGVAFLFDSFGFQRGTRDRNGNELEYVYRWYSSITGQECASNDPVLSLVAQTQLQNGLCIPRLREVRQPTWADTDEARHRRVAIDYDEPTGTLVDVLGTFGLPSGTLLGATYVTGGGPRIDRLTDAAGLVYDLQYHGANGPLEGYLERFVENAGSGMDTPPRVTRLAYCEGQPDPVACPALAEPRAGDVHQLTAVVADDDPAKPATTLEYEPRDTSDPVRPPAPRRAVALTKRSGERKLFGYTAESDAEGARFTVHEHTTGTRYLTSDVTLDARRRPHDVSQRATDLASEQDQVGDVPEREGSTTTRVVWNDDENKPATLVEAVGQPNDERTTTFDYLTGGSGALAQRTVTDADETHVTEFDYYEGREGGFIADLERLVLPGGRRWQFVVDAQGNVRQTVTPGGALVDVDYGAGGVVTRAQDEVEQWTVFEDHDLGGQPRTVRRPSEPGLDRTWRYDYDARGDVLTTRDPRATGSGYSDAYVTSLKYDAFNRMVEEHAPRDSADTSLPEQQRFSLRTYAYNRDGRMTATAERRADPSLAGTPGAMKTSTIKYDAGGRPTTSTRPAGTAGAPRDQVTRFVFDGADRLIAQAAPKATGWDGDYDAKAASIRGEQLVACEGSGEGASHAHLTRHCLDHAGRTAARAEYAPGETLPHRVNAFAHDGLGRVVGQNDANRNAYYEGGVQKPLSIAAAIEKVRVPGTRRLTAEYDAVDRAVRELERPDDGGAVRERRMHYNAVGDLDETRTIGSGRPDRVTRMTYDGMGRMTSRTDPLGRKTCWKRRPDGLPTSVTTPRGTAGQEGYCEVADHLYAFHTTNLDYDRAGDLTFRSIPRAKNQDLPDGAIDWHVKYERDVVGNPWRITDARKASFENRFYDGGEVRRTDRPSWWGVRWGGSEGNPDPGENFKGSDAADLEVAVGGPQVVEREGRTANAERSGQTPEKPNTLGKGDFGEPDQQKLPDWLPEMGRTKFRYDEGMRLTGILDAEDRETKLLYDDAGRVTEKSWPLSPGQRIRHRYSYDDNGNLTQSLEDWNPRDPVKTTFGYDGYDRRQFEETEGASATDVTASPEAEITRFSYDAGDRLRTRRMPRGGTFEFGYTSLDELAYETNPVDETWRYEYDVFGERRQVVSPHAVGVSADPYTENLTYDDAGQTIKSQRSVAGEGVPTQNLEVDFAYDDDGHRETVEQPGAPDRVTTKTEFDGRGLPWRTTVSGGSDEAARKRVTITEHDANGNVRRVVNPEGIGDDDLPRAEDDGTNSPENLAAASNHATVRVYNPDDLMTSERMPWHGADDERYSREWVRDPQHGWVTEATLPHEVGSTEIWRMRYDRNHAGWVTTATDQTRGRGPAETGDDTFTFVYDDRGNQTSWTTEHANQNADGRAMRWTYWPNGLMKTRTAVKTLDSDGSDDQTTRRTYDYLYNKNRSLVRVIDRDARRDLNAVEGNDGPEDRIRRTTVFSRDLAERETRVDEMWTGGKDVWLGYDTGNTGRLTQRRTDGELSSDGGAYTGARAKTTTFDYDSLGRELEMTVDGPGGSRPTTTRWFQGGQMRERNKARGATDRWSWDALGQKRRHERIKPGETSDPTPMSYDYDDNGNRTEDERGEHDFNARGHLVQWTRRADRDDEKDGWITDYTVDGSGQVRAKVERDGDAKKLEVTHDIAGTRIESTKTTSHQPVGAVKTTDTYRYDDAGNVQRVYRETDAPVPVEREPVPKTALTPDECEDAVTDDEADGRSAAARYCYDEFNRQVFSAGEGIEPRYITYDGLDRRDISVKKAGTSVTDRRDYSYIGTSELLAGRSTRATANGSTTKRLSFDYDSQGDRQGVQMDDGQEADTDDRYHAYAKDANGSVTGLENEDGSSKAGAKYEYDPYGDIDNKRSEDAEGDDDAKSGITGDAAENPFRFEGFYYDSGIKTYDMHARHYRPELSRFLSRDQYAAASGEEALQADPLTQNRYAFAGGNPVTNVEFDGHRYGGGGGIGGPRTASGRPTTVAKASDNPGSDPVIVYDGRANARGVAQHERKAVAAAKMGKPRIAQAHINAAAHLEQQALQRKIDMYERQAQGARIMQEDQWRKDRASAPEGAKCWRSLESSPECQKELGKFTGGNWGSLIKMTTVFAGGGPAAFLERKAVEMVGARVVGRLSSAKRGDLSRREQGQIQDVVDAAGRPITVVGSAARGERRNRWKPWLPFGKGPGGRSDIDYAAPRSSLPYFDDQLDRLPGLDPSHGIIPGPHDPNIGPGIRFEPRR
jgi:RHS repeat-associated protein